MSEQPLPWSSFVESLPSRNPYNHEFRVCNWGLIYLAYVVRQCGPVRLLDSFQGLAIVIAIAVFLVDLSYREEERKARELTAVSNAYSVLNDVVREVKDYRGLAPRNRRAMVALEELYSYSQLSNSKYLVGLSVPKVRFGLIAHSHYSGCEDIDDPRRIALKYADLENAIFNGGDLSVADLSNARLVGTKFSHATLNYTCFTHADLRRARLNQATLVRANLSNADLRYADLSGSELWFSNLSNADLSWADLSGADLKGANLNGVRFHETKISDAIFRDVMGLTEKHIENSCICSDRMPRNLPKKKTFSSVKSCDPLRCG